MRSVCLASPPVFSPARRTAVYGPVRTVVWEGRAGDRSPYPDLDGSRFGTYLVEDYFRPWMRPFLASAQVFGNRILFSHSKKSLISWSSL